MSKAFAMLRGVLGSIQLLQGTADPTSGAGVTAPIGSKYLRSGTAGDYLKYGAGDTQWELLRTSFSWYVVRDYGATGDGTTDDTTAIQAAINACATAGGGVVYFSGGTYCITQLTLIAKNNVVLRGAGSATILKWKWNAAGVTGSMITLDNVSGVRVQDLILDGSLLTNPAAARGNHLILLSGSAGAVINTRLDRLTTQNLPSSSGDGIHVIGTAGALVQRLWIKRCSLAGSRYALGMRQAITDLFCSENTLSGGESEIGFVANADLNSTRILIEDCTIVHTNGSVAEAVRIEGGTTTYITQLICAGNVIQGGFITTTNVQYASISANTQTSGVFSSTNPAWRVFGDVSRVTFVDNVIDRSSGAGVGYCISLEKSGGVSPKYIRLGALRLVNETVGGGAIKLVDPGDGISIGGGTSFLSIDAGGSTMFAFDVQAVTSTVQNLLIGPGIIVAANAGSIKAPVRLLANGANFGDGISILVTASNVDYSVQYEIGGGGGTFNPVLRQNTVSAAVGDSNLVGGANPVEVVGMNLGTFGPQAFLGSGSPEGSVTARVGSVYHNSAGGQANSFWIKETGTGNTGWVRTGGDAMQFGAGDIGTGSAQVFLAPGWIATATTAGEPTIAVNRPGTIRNLRVQVATAGVTATTNTYTVRKNAANTSLVATIGNTATGAAIDTNTADAFTVTATDLLSIGVSKGGTVATGQNNVTAVVELA